MNFSEVSKDDLKHMAQVVNTIHISEFTLNGKDVCAAADSFRWLQRAAMQMSQAYQLSLGTEKPEPAPGAMPDGVTVKAFQPGKASDQ